MKTIKEELPLICIALLPFLYLLLYWNSFSNQVPVHWNINGEIDRYGNKSELLLLITILSSLTFAIFKFLPKLDPKQKLQNMGKKYDSLRMILTCFMSALAIYILYSAQTENKNAPLILPLIGLLFAALGNYMKTIKQNYFIGIKTPWTLENEEVWKKTHLLAGNLWFVGGLLSTATIFLKGTVQFYTFMTIVVVIVVIPVIYSYFEFKKQK